jgi:hypothetical protein
MIWPWQRRAADEQPIGKERDLVEDKPPINRISRKSLELIAAEKGITDCSQISKEELYKIAFGEEARS